MACILLETPEENGLLCETSQPLNGKYFASYLILQRIILTICLFY